MTSLNISPQLALAIVLAASLLSCEGPTVTLADAVGTYRADVPSGRATLVINGDGSWEYHIEGPSPFRKNGKWMLEFKESTPSMMVITFVGFDYGFRLTDLLMGSLGHYNMYFEKSNSGRVRTCEENLGVK
jgi:hypothetical protein